MQDPEKLKALGREHARLERIRRTAARYGQARRELAGAQELLHDTDPAIAELAQADVERLVPALERLDRELRQLLIPPDPLDSRDTLVEIRAGAGGDEAALFAADLFRMYTRYAERHGWGVEVVDLSEGTLGGIKGVIFKVSGEDAYGRLRHESGVHREIGRAHV